MVLAPREERAPDATVAPRRQDDQVGHVRDGADLARVVRRHPRPDADEADDRALLRRLGFLPLPGRLVPSGLTLTVEALADPPDARWFAPSSWYLTFGDGDVV